MGERGLKGKKIIFVIIGWVKFLPKGLFFWPKMFPDQFTMDDKKNKTF